MFKGWADSGCGGVSHGDREKEESRMVLKIDVSQVPTMLWGRVSPGQNKWACLGVRSKAGLLHIAFHGHRAEGGRVGGR